MEDVVAVAVELDTGETRYFVTWGRVQHSVDPAPLEEIVLTRSSGFDLGGRPLRARLCLSLQEARDEPYFFEALVSFASKPTDAADWLTTTNERMRNGKELYYLGRPR